MIKELQTRFIAFTQRKKYELLLFALVQHLFIAIIPVSLHTYTTFLWPTNMLILGLFSVGVFSNKTSIRRYFKNAVSIIVVGIPIYLAYTSPSPEKMVVLSLCYTTFFSAIFIEVLLCLFRAEERNLELLYASICGYFLLLEIGIFLMLAIYHLVDKSFKGIDIQSFTSIYLDFVYLCSVSITSTGFGDIVPTHHISKLALAVFGILAHLYSIVLLGILIGEYANRSSNHTKN